MPFAIPVLAQEYQTHFPPGEFKARWEKVFDKIRDNAIAIVQGAPDPGGFIYPRQSNTFYYLCGVENLYSYLMLDGRSRKVTLYLSTTRSGGRDRVLSLENPERVKELTGVDEVLGTDELRNLRTRVIYTPFSPAEGQGQSRGELTSANRRIESDYWDGRIPRETHFIIVILITDLQLGTLCFQSLRGSRSAEDEAISFLFSNLERSNSNRRLDCF